MELAIEVMMKSIQEPRTDKSSPKVGAVLIKADGTVETAFRGELRHGDHAEFTLLERKNRANLLDGGTLFATLEPCAPNARKFPKLGCAERIVNARIKKVWIGIEDPDPTVDRKGIKYLIENGIEVELFDADLQKTIRDANLIFIQEAEERAKKAKEPKEEVLLTPKEKAEPNAEYEDFSKESIDRFIEKAKLDVEFNTINFNKVFTQLGLVEQVNNIWKPTGLGLLLFGTRPQLIFQNAVIRATFKTEGRSEEIITIDGPLTRQADQIQSWYETRIGSQTDRSKVERQVNYDFPMIVLREAIINAIVHRDYDITGAPIYFEINDEYIIIKSPGLPVEPLKMEQMMSFSAPSLSRNPKIMFVFDQLRLVEQRGLGFQTMKDLPGKFNLPLPTVTYDSPYMVITFPRSEIAAGELIKTSIGTLSPEMTAKYQWIVVNGPVSSSQFAEHFGISTRTARRMLSNLREMGIVVDEGGSNSPTTKYRATTLSDV